jgi:hypothetical protein
VTPLGLFRRIGARARNLLQGGVDDDRLLKSNGIMTLDRFVRPRFPIDLVYTWVDGNDPPLSEKRARYDASEQRHRYTDHQELRFSLRSVHAYLPWINHIYIVTDGQRPEWLVEHPKVTVVDHTQVLDAKYLPTFNSHVIESALHRIPGISEHYVYLNDDIFFLRPMGPEDFYTSSGLVYGSVIGVALPEDPTGQLHSVTAQMNALEMINRRYECSFRYRMKHTYYPQRRSVVEDLEREFADDFDAMRQHRFRTAQDFVTCTTLHAMWAYATGRGLLRTNRTHYISVRSHSARDLYRRVLAAKGLPYASSSLCLNDAPSADGSEVTGYTDHLRQFCEAYFPDGSPFEAS